MVVTLLAATPVSFTARLGLFTVLLFIHSILTDPNLKDGHPDLLDGGKVFLEIAALVTVAAVSLRVRLHGRGLRPLRTRETTFDRIES